MEMHASIFSSHRQAGNLLPKGWKAKLRSRVGWIHGPMVGYFNANMAFTCAVMVTCCGVNSCVGGAASMAIMGPALRDMGAKMRTFSMVSTDAYESSPRVRAAAVARDCAEARA